MAWISRLSGIHRTELVLPILPVLPVFPGVYPEEMSLIKKSIRVKVIGL